MTSHADTIRLAINAAGAEGHLVAGAWDALDALLAENQRLRDALERIADPCEITGDGPLEEILAAPHGTGERELRARMEKAREALAGDAE